MGFLNGLNNLYKSAKEIGWKFIEQQVTDAKKHLTHYPWYINSVVNGVRGAIAGVFNFTTSHLIDKPIEKLKENSEQTKKAIGEAVDEFTLVRGADADKSLGNILKDIDDKIGATDVEIAEGKLFAEQRKKYSDWLSGKALPVLDRYPPAELSDADVIEREQRDYEHFNSVIESENQSPVSSHSEPDDTLVHSLVHLINARRESAGLTPLHIGKNLSDRALRRSGFQMENPTENPAPLAYLELPPLNQKDPSFETEEVVPVARYRSGKPQFHLTKEKRRRIVAGSIQKVDENNYKMKFHESEESFAQRARDLQTKRMNYHFDDFTLRSDFNDDNYPTDGDPYQILDRILENPEYRLALMSEKNEIGIGVTREGPKVLINFLLMDRQDPDPDDILPTKPLHALDNEWWLQQIPEDIRDPEEESKMNFQEIYDAGFNSGYSLFQLYLFYKRIEEMSHNRQIFIPKTSFHPQEKILRKHYDLLHIHISIDGKTHVVKLIKGTNLVDIPQERGDKKEGDSTSVLNVVTLDKYFDMIKDRPEPKSIDFTYVKGKKPKKEEKKVEEEDEEDLDPTLPY